MTDRYGYGSSRFLQRRRQPVAPQGEITGKAFVDTIQIAERRENAVDASRAAKSYPGGENNDNLTVMPGELVFGLRSNASTFGSGNGPNEFLLSSFAGLYYGDYDSDDALMRDWYCAGVSKDEFRVGASDQPENGFAFTRHGHVSTINTGGRDIFAGDRVAWRVPRRHHERSQNNGVRGGGLQDSILAQHHPGTPNTKFLAELEPVDYTDFQTSTSGALELMQRLKAQQPAPGIADVEFSAFIKPEFGREHNKTALSDGQEEAMGYKFGLSGVVLRGIESLVRQGVINVEMGDGNPTNAPAAAVKASSIADEIGLFTNKSEGPTTVTRMIGDIMGMDQAPFTDIYTDTIRALQLNQNSAATSDYKDLTRHLMTVLCGGITASAHHKRERVVGVATNGCRPTQTLNLNVGGMK